MDKYDEKAEGIIAKSFSHSVERADSSLASNIAQALRDSATEARDSRHSRVEEALGEAVRIFKAIERVPTYRVNPKECAWCGAGKAGFHHNTCPRTYAHNALARIRALSSGDGKIEAKEK